MFDPRAGSMAGSSLLGWFPTGCWGIEGVGDGMPPWWSSRVAWFGEDCWDRNSGSDISDFGMSGGNGISFVSMK